MSVGRPHLQAASAPGGTANGGGSGAALTAPASRLRPSVAAFAILGLAVAVAASLYVLSNAAEAPEANALVRAIMALTALAVGLYLWQRQPQNWFGPALAGGVLFLSPMALAVSEDPWMFTIGRTVAALAIVYAVGLVLIFPDGRLEGRGPRRLLAATIVGSGVLWTAALLFADILPAGGPLVPCVGGCPDNAAQVVEIGPDPSRALGLAYGIFCAGIGLAGAGLLVRRLRDATPVRRRAIVPVLAIVPAVFIGMGAFVLVREAAPDSTLLDPLGWLVMGAFALFPSLVCAGLIRGRAFAASALEQLVERLSRERSPVGLQEVMRAVLRDPALELLFWSARTRSYVDAQGRDVHLPRGDAGRSVTRIDRDGPVAAIVHESDLDSQPQLIQAVASAVLMAMENAGLQADLQAAVFDERRRIARDMHDGLAQDLVFISMQGRELADRDPRAEAIATAAGQALAHARGAILALTDPVDESLPTAVARVATSLADRSGTRLELELDDQAETGPRAQDGLLLIVSEAISNATRHGNASKIHVALSAEGGLRLAISDDGCGFHDRVSTNGPETGFGLTSMQERAEDLGGELELRSHPGEGTKVEVMLP